MMIMESFVSWTSRHWRPFKQELYMCVVIFVVGSKGSVKLSSGPISAPRVVVWYFHKCLWRCSRWLPVSNDVFWRLSFCSKTAWDVNNWLYLNRNTSVSVDPLLGLCPWTSPGHFLPVGLLFFSGHLSSLILDPPDLLQPTGHALSHVDITPLWTSFLAANPHYTVMEQTTSYLWHDVSYGQYR